MDTDVEQSLSDYWRINKSSIKELELVEMLRSLQRLSRHHLPDTIKLGYTDDYAGYCTAEEIKINPALALEAAQYPVGGKNFDTIAGVTLHEIAHHLIQSPTILENLKAKTRGSVGKQTLATELSKLGEDYVADGHFKGKQNQYIQKARRFYSKHYRAKQGIDSNDGFDQLNTGNPLADAFNAYASLIIYQEQIDATKLSAKGNELLQIIFKNFGKLREQDSQTRTVTYLKTMWELNSIMEKDAKMQRVTDPKGKRLRSQPRIQDYADDKVGELAKGIEGLPDANTKTVDVNQTTLTPEEMQKIEEYQAEEASDVTDLLNNLIAEQIQQEYADGSEDAGTLSREQVRQMVKQKMYSRRTDESRECVYHGKSAETIRYWDTDEDMRKALSWLRNIKSVRDRITLRRLESGKLDSRRLYRSSIDGCIFKNTKTKKNQQRRIWLVMDGSSSMSGESHIYELCATVNAVLPNARVLLYGTADHNNTHIYRLDDSKGMLRQSPHGNTPSGDAVLYAATVLNKEGGGLLLHFTDGEPNTGLKFEEALDIVDCKFPKVTVLNVMPERASRSYQVSKRTGKPYVKTQTIGFDIVSGKHDGKQGCSINTGFAVILQQAIARMMNLS
tara:strand:+ start:1558 stop:3408 length:1851 start_codon:yes stop_codon:yes gene_type:complete